MQTLLTDLRYGARLLLRSPGFTSMAVAALAIGIGANLTIFGFANDLLLSAPQGVADPGRVVRVFSNRFSNTAAADYEAFRDRNHTFASLAGFRAESLSLRTAGAPEQVFGLAVSGNYFAALEIPAAIGRPLVASDDRAGAPGVVLLSDRCWRLRFGGSPQAVGQTVTINGRPTVVIGVTPAGFTGTHAPLVPDLFVPLAHTARADGSVQMIGRLRQGVSIGQAQADLTTLAAQLAQARAQDGQRAMISVYPARTLAPELLGPAAIFTGLLLAVVALVLFIACLNIANLLLARSVARRREIGVRLALGASRGRIVRQLLTESLLLSAAGGVGASVVALVAARPIAAAVSSIPAPVPLGLVFLVDWRVMAVAVGLSVATTIMCGLVPALQSSTGDVLPALKDGVATSGPTRSRARGVFVMIQVAMSTLLLVVAALFVRGLASARTLDRGLVTDGVLVASVDLRSAGYTSDRSAAFYERLLERLNPTPGIMSATIVDIVPLTLSNRADEMTKDGQEPSAPADALLVYRNSVSSGHFRTLGIPLLAGRDFDARDRAGAPPVVIVNETLAGRLWPGENPIGKRLRNQGGSRQPPRPSFEIVGLVRDSKYATVGEDPKAFMYRPLAQELVAEGNILVKSAGNAMDALPALRASVESLDPNLPLFNVMTLDAAASISFLPVKVAAALAGVLGALALALGAIGLYGVMSYLVRQRTREIGIRMALGAGRASVISLITKQGMRWTAIGLVLGLCASLAAARLLAGFLYGVGPADPVAFPVIAVILLATAYAACYVPARRASGIDPLDALRDE